MKLIVCFICLIFTESLLAQNHDYQWMIFNGCMKQGVNYSGVVDGTFTIDGLQQPNRQFEDRASNDFFIIYEDGSYYLSDRSGQNSDVQTVTTLPGVAPDDNIVAYRFVDPIQSPLYFYLTNRYENDDPKDRVVVGNGTGVSSGNTIEDVPISSAVGGLITHQTPKVGADIVFIIDEDLNKCNYTLCLDGYEDLSFEPSNFINTDLQGCNPSIGQGNVMLFNGSSNMPSLSYKAFDGNRCVDLSLEEGDMYLKFRVQGNQEELEEGEITYILTPNSISRCSADTIRDQIDPNGHDPNFVQLQCLWEDDEGNYRARYHVECFNASYSSEVNSVNMSFEFPFFIDVPSIQYYDWMICCEKGCGEVGIESFHVESSIGQNVVLSFGDLGLDKYSNSLDTNEICLYTAFIEFETIITVPQGEDILLMDLSLNTPQTFFEGDDFTITTFIQDRECASSTQLGAIGFETLSETGSSFQAANQYFTALQNQQNAGNEEMSFTIDSLLTIYELSNLCLPINKLSAGPCYDKCRFEGNKPDKPRWIYWLIVLSVMTLVYSISNRLRKES